jgi:hypothetical protein
MIQIVYAPVMQTTRLCPQANVKFAFSLSVCLDSLISIVAAKLRQILQDAEKVGAGNKAVTERPSDPALPMMKEVAQLVS